MKKEQTKSRLLLLWLFTLLVLFNCEKESINNEIVKDNNYESNINSNIKRIAINDLLMK